MLQGDYGGPLVYKERIVGIAIPPISELPGSQPSFFTTLREKKPEIERCIREMENEYTFSVYLKDLRNQNNSPSINCGK